MTASVVKRERCQFDLPRFIPRVSDLIEQVAGSGKFTYSDHEALCVGLFFGLNGLASCVDFH